MKKACVVCGGGFEGRRTLQKYCSHACWRANENRLQAGRRATRRPVRSCAACGCDFHPAGPQKLCSATCRRVEKNQRRHLPAASRACVACGAEFNAAGRTPKKTCSPSCGVLWKKSRDARRHARSYVPAGTIKRCIVCGTGFVFHRNKMTCSAECSRANGAIKSAEALARNPERQREYLRKHRAIKSAAIKLVREILSKGPEALL